ncbi:MAG: DMT family transporter, partial [Actinomyces sp.]
MHPTRQPAPLNPARPAPLVGLDGHAWVLILALSLLWGLSFFFNGVAVPEVGARWLVVVRVALAAGALWLAVLVTGRPLPRSGRALGALLVMGVLNNAIPFTLIAWGQATIGAGLASILNATTPLFGVLVAGAFLADERLTGRRVLAALVGFAGVVVMIGADVLSGIGRDVPAQLAVLGAALSYAFAGAWGRRFRAMGLDPVVIAAGQTTAAALVMAPVAALGAPPPALPSAEALAAMVALALVSTAGAYVLYFRLLARAGAANTLLVTFLVPVWAILLGT